MRDPTVCVSVRLKRDGGIRKKHHKYLHISYMYSPIQWMVLSSLFGTHGS
jgi:hypothetical protein